MNTNSSLAAGALLIALTAVASAKPLTGHQYLKEAKISLQSARAIALRVLPGGKIVDQELERERGGSGLRYSFDIRVAHGEREVGVDAKTGKVLENSVEGPNKD
ncbi:MAG TPA: PepSY domain-containing protein [Steroidobacteraceae bacterium]|nr:PepSY domain-containing protein [Steroidobacteraceae bacterium]